MKPLCVDLFTGCFGWSRPWLEFGGRVVGFDISHEPYHGPVPTGAHLVLQDVRTLHGSQFKDASLILASSPCQAYSWMAMPWSRGKQVAAAIRGRAEFPEKYSGPRSLAELNELFEQPRRIQREASEAAGRYIPMVQENVRGAQPWVGQAAWSFGSFYLWGDVPALMPMTMKRKLGGGASWYPPSDPRHTPGLDLTRLAGMAASKNDGGSWFNVAHNTTSGKNRNPVHEGTKAGKANADPDKMQDWGRPPMATREQAPDQEKGTKGFAARLGDSVMPRRHGSKSSARKAASARIAVIPEVLARHICQTYFPK